MPVFALAPMAATAFWGAAAAGATAGAQIYGAHKQASATNKAAQLQTDAANRSADAQLQSDREQRAYLEEQAKRDEARYETDRRANYDQWAAREGRIGSLASLVGMGPRQIPGYVPSGTAMSGPASQSGAPSGAPGGIPKATGDLAKDLAVANQITGGKGVTPTDLEYWAKAGYAKDPQYFFQKMLGMDAGPQDAPKMGPYAGRTGGAAMMAPKPYAPMGGSIASMTQQRPTLTPPLTPALQAPQVQYRPRSIRELARI
jgi:hypothetical protein